MELNSDRWLQAHTESGTCMYTLSRCMTLADLHGDGDFKLILADLGNGNDNIKLKTFKGAALIGETTLLDFPAAVCSFYNETHQSRLPVVGIAAGQNIYVYRNFKPYYKFCIPSLPVSPLESDLWMQARNSEISPTVLREMLQNIQLELGLSCLSLQSQKLLSAPMNDESELRDVLENFANQPVERLPVITCMTLLRKNTTTENSISILVCGCEHGDIYFIDPQAFILVENVVQPSNTIPFGMQVTGLFDVDFKVIVSNRNGQISIIQKGSKEAKLLVQLDSQPIDFILSPEGSKIFFITQSSLLCYNQKGRRQWRESLPNQAINIISLNLENQGLHLLAVSLKGGLIHLYNDKQLVEIISAPESVAGMIFGRFGQEDHCLILITDGGTFQIKMLKRTARFTDHSTAKGSDSVKKFQLPKRSKLFLDEIAREKNNPLELHQRFQRELFELRLSANELLTEKVKRSVNLISDDKKMPVKISAQVFGLGPTFKIRVTLDNMADSSTETDYLLSQNLFLLFQFNPKLYRLENSFIPVPFLCPGLEYVFETSVFTLVEVMIAEDMMVFLIAPPQTKPLLSASIHIPICDVLPIDV